MKTLMVIAGFVIVLVLLAGRVIDTAQATNAAIVNSIVR